MDTVVRRIRADEGSTLKTMRLRALGDAPGAFAQTLDAVAGRSDAEWDSDAGRWSSAPDAASFFAEAGGTLVGMVGVFVEAGAGELVAMWTAPEARCRGVGADLVAAVIGWCRAAGLVRVRTGVAEGNRAAARLYERAGFVPTGETRPLPSGPGRRELRYTLTLPRG